jgi:hypothetical protein
MKKKVMLGIGIGIVALSMLAVLTVSVASAQNGVYLIPQHSNASSCNTAEVQIWANTIDTFGFGQINLTYTHCCANVTNWEYGPLWDGTWDSSVDGKEWLVFLRPFGQLPVSGTVLIGTLTIHCCNEGECVTPLTFSPPSKLGDPIAGDLTVIWTDGTFNCTQPPLLCTNPDPPLHDFGSVPVGQTETWAFDITNCGGGTLTWTVSDDQPWITVSPIIGTTTTETDTVTVTIDTTGLTCDATHTGTITVNSNDGTKTGTISVSVPPCLPLLCTSPDPPSHDFGSVPVGQTETWAFDITNCGDGTLTWTVSDDQPWITVNPASGTTTTETDTVTVTIDTTGLTCDATHTGTITVNSNDGTKTGTIRVYVPPCIIENEVYLDPQHSSTSFCNTVKVQIWANTTDTFGAGQINLTYTHCCANVTDWEYGPLWQGTWDSSVDGREWLVFLRPLGQPTVSGAVLIGNLTIHCCSESECVTPLTFSPPSKLNDPIAGDLAVNWIDGTFACTRVCGDVNCDDIVDVSDLSKLLYYVGFPGDPRYTICNEWAADVNCDHSVDVSDLSKLLYYVGFPGDPSYTLNCCEVY